MLTTKDIHIGKLAVQRKYVTPAQLQTVERRSQTGDPPRLLGQCLIDEKLLTPQQLFELVQVQQAHFAKRIPFYLERRKDRIFANLALSQEYVTEDAVIAAKRTQDLRWQRERQYYRLWKILVEQRAIEHAFVAKLVTAMNEIVLVCDYCDTQYDRRKYRGMEQADCRRCGALLFARGQPAPAAEAVPTEQDDGLAGEPIDVEYERDDWGAADDDGPAPPSEAEPDDAADDAYAATVVDDGADAGANRPRRGAARDDEDEDEEPDDDAPAAEEPDDDDLFEDDESRGRRGPARVARTRRPAPPPGTDDEGRRPSRRRRPGRSTPRGRREARARRSSPDR